MSIFFPRLLCLFTAAELFAGEKFHSTSLPESKVWQEFREDAVRGEASKLPDFSRAGYRRGETGIPDVRGPIFNVLDYGAVADDQTSDEAAIRSAAVAAEKAGGGVVFFPKGTYLLWTSRNQIDPIRIHSSRIVFRGEGDYEGGTILHFIHHGLNVGEYGVPKLGSEFNSLKSLLHFGPPMEAFGPSSAVKTGVTMNVPSGTAVLPVKNSAGFEPGQWIVVGMKSKAALPAFLEHQAPFAAWTKLSEGLSFTSIHQID